MVDNRRPDGEPTVEHGGRGRGDAGFLQIDDDLGIQPIRVGAAVAEADNVELNGSQRPSCRRKDNLAFQK